AALGLELVSLALTSPTDFESTSALLSTQHVDALFPLGDPLIYVLRAQIAELAARHHLPDMYDQKLLGGARGLASYGPRVEVQFRQSATYVDKILKGRSPADLPVEQPREFDFVINLRTAQALGLTSPQHVLLQATEVIQ